MSSRFFLIGHRKRWALAATVLGSVAAFALALWQGRVTAKPQEGSPAQQAPVRPAPAAAADGVEPSQVPAPSEAEQPAEPPKPPQDPEHAHIVFTTIPMTNAKVVWGRRTLGTIRYGRPLTVVRPRDSGPLDVMVYAPGYLPVQTRAHTFEDQQIAVRLTTPENKSALWGYRAPLDAGIPLDGSIELEGGAAPASPEELPSIPLSQPPAAQPPSQQQPPSQLPPGQLPTYQPL